MEERAQYYARDAPPPAPVLCRSQPVKEVIYRRPNRRKCHWLWLYCLKRNEEKCSTKCPDYISVAEWDRKQRERHER